MAAVSDVIAVAGAARSGAADARMPLHPALAPLACWFAVHGCDVRDALAGHAAALPDCATLDAWAARLHAQDPRRLRFVEARGTKTAALAYELRIRDAGEVPTRPRSMHDTCNALAWLAYPRTKAALNAIHCSAGQAPDLGRRGPVRDTATLLDEHGVIVLARDPGLVALWQRHAWRELFHDRRDEVADRMRIGVLGHGLMAALARPFPCLTAKALVLATDALPSEREPVAVLDVAAASWLEANAAALTTSMLLPLPVSAWPEWAVGATGPDRFGDTRVFRPARGPR